MNRPGCLLDTGPLVALFSKEDQNHKKACALLANCLPPLKTCEAVIAEACYLLRKIHPDAPSEVLSLAQKGFFQIALTIHDHWTALKILFKKYKDQPISLADACLIRCAEIHQEPRILTFDSDFNNYRWDRKKRFEILA